MLVLVRHGISLRLGHVNIRYMIDLYREHAVF